MTKVLYYTQKRNKAIVRRIDMSLCSLYILLIAIATLLLYELNKVNEVDFGISTEYAFEERISFKEQMNMYIDSLPLPKEEIEVVQVAETVEQEETKENVQFVDMSNKYVEEVKGTDPTVKVFNVSGYCTCIECCEKTDAITASGKVAQQWHTVAAGTNYKFGTKIYIPELSNTPSGGWFVVEDRGGAITNERLDICFIDHQTALEFGRHSLECYIYEN